MGVWLEKPHEINTALNVHQYTTFEPLQDTSSQVYGPRHLPLRSGPLRARASMVWSPPVAEHAEAAFCGARAAWATP